MAKETPDGQYTLEDGLLLYQGRVVVADVDHERTKLIKEAHSQLSTAYPGNTKTITLLAARYYWPGLAPDVRQFIRNCACRASYYARDKTPGLYYLLPVPDHP